MIYILNYKVYKKNSTHEDHINFAKYMLYSSPLPFNIKKIIYIYDNKVISLTKENE